MSYRTVGVLFALVGLAVVVHAQEPLQLHIANGRVTLHARNVPVRTILAEWSRIGGARVVNGDRVAGAPVTLDLQDVPERQALDILLRGVSGYMLAAREPGTAVGASAFDRIMILPTSAAPRNPPPAPAPVFQGFSGAPRGVVRQVVPAVEPDDQDADDPDADAGAKDDIPVAQPTPIPRPMPIPRPAATPGTPLAPPATLEEPEDDPQPDEPPAPVVVTPTNPFGVPAGSSDRPGVVAPSAQPAQTPSRNGPQD